MWIKASFIVFLLSMLSTIWYILEMDTLKTRVNEQQRIITVLQGTTRELLDRIAVLENK